MKHVLMYIIINVSKNGCYDMTIVLFVVKFFFLLTTNIITRKLRSKSLKNFPIFEHDVLKKLTFVSKRDW